MKIQNRIFRILVAVVFSFQTLAFAQDRRTTHRGDLTSSEVIRLKSVGQNNETYIIDSNGQIFWGRIESIEKLSNGQDYFIFDRLVPYDKNIHPTLLGNGVGQKSLSPDVEKDSIINQQNSSSSASESGNGFENAAKAGAINGAIKGTVSVLTEALGPSDETKAQAKAAQARQDQAENDYKTTMNQGQQAGRDIVNKMGQSLDEAHKFDIAGLINKMDFKLGVSELPPFINIKDKQLGLELKNTWEILQGYRPTSETHSNLKDIGLAAVATSVELGVEGDEPSARVGLEIAKCVTGFIIGFNPVTSFVSDAYAVFYGRDILSPEVELQHWERTMAGGSLILTVATGGLAVPIIKIATTNFRIAKKLNSKPAFQALEKGFSGVKESVRVGIPISKNVMKARDFSKNILKSKVKNLPAIHHFSLNWTDQMKADFSQFSKEVDIEIKKSGYDPIGPAVTKGVRPEIAQAQYELAKAATYGIENYGNHPGRVADRLLLIDFSKEVRLDKIPKGTLLYQYGHSGVNPGDFVAITKETPSRVGIGEIGKNPITGKLEPVQLRRVTTTEDVVVLRSTAASGIDNRVDGHFQEFDGEGIQFLIGKSKLKLEIKTGN